MTPNIPSLELNDGRSIPQLGYGVYKVPAEETADLVLRALEIGYRHIDTATLYGNEVGVGEAVRRSGLPRDEVFVTTKVWQDRHGYDNTLRAFDESLDRLGLDEVDLYLIHWPAPEQNLYVETWTALERLRDEGRARSIGVANFAIPHLERLAAESDVVPAVNQIELHPAFPQDELRAYDSEHGIVTEAWAPLARGGALDNPVITGLAAKHSATPAQVILAWHLALGNVAIPKTVNPERMRENLGAIDVALDEDDLAAIATLSRPDGRTGKDPETFG